MENLREELIQYEMKIHGTSEKHAEIIVDSYLAVKNFAN